jgi:predicted outer membrane lipoprotein
MNWLITSKIWILLALALGIILALWIKRSRG